MKKNCIVALLLLAISCNVFADNVVVVKFDGKDTEISKIYPSDSLLVSNDDGVLTIKNIARQQKATIRLSGKSEDYQFIFKTSTKDRIELNNLTLQSSQGAPIWIKNKKKVEIVCRRNTNNSLIVTACPDTANNKAAVIYAKDKLKLSGKGSLTCLATGNGCKGIYAKDDIIIEELTLDIKTTGDNLGRRSQGFASPPFGSFPEVASPPFGELKVGGGDVGSPAMDGFGDMPEEMKKQFEEMRKRFENGEFPPMGMPGWHEGRPDSKGHLHEDERPNMFSNHGGGFGGFGSFGESVGPPDDEREDGGGFKQKYIYTCKGIKSTKTITINSGKVTVYTSSAGAEGIEGKKGVTINGGEVNINAKDDAVNATGPIVFNGGKTIALSRTNDAVDANPEGGFMFPNFFGGGHPFPFEESRAEHEEQKQPEPLIFISGGEVCAYSHVGPPEEGFDSDFNPISVTGGKCFSIGAGMGDMPSVPTVETATQPTALIVGLDVTRGKLVSLKNDKGRTIYSVVAPFTFRRSSSMITCPEFKVGETYTIETEGYKKEFKMEENFTIVR